MVILIIRVQKLIAEVQLASTDLIWIWKSKGQRESDSRKGWGGGWLIVYYRRRLSILLSVFYFILPYVSHIFMLIRGSYFLSPVHPRVGRKQVRGIRQLAESK